MKYLSRRSGLRFSILFTLLFSLLMSAASVRAFVSVSMQLDVDQNTTVIGKTPKMTIRLVNSETNTIKVTNLTCRLEGSSIVQTSSFGTSYDLQPNKAVLVNVYYRAVAAGTTRILCTVNVINPANGETWETSTINEVTVIGETRLYMTTYSATQTATVGQTFFIINKFGNRGTTPFTNVYFTCVYFGGDVAGLVSSSMTPTMLQPGQSGFIEQKWVAQRPGRFVLDCSVTGTDSTGTQVTVPSERITVDVR